MSQKDTRQDNAPRIAVVTDSAAALDPQLVQRLSARGNFVLVPMPVTIRTPGEPDRQLQDLTAAEVDEAIMLAHVMGQTVSTSGPAPGVFADVYDELASRGFTHVLSVHLSGELSGTVEAARTGARLSRLGSAGVSVVDSRTVAGAYGHAVVRALEVLNSASDAGSSVEYPSPDCPSPNYPSPAQLVDYIQSVCEQSTLYFYIPTLDALRRGGRVSPALAMVGQMFQIKPIGTITEGKLAYVERPRTAARALERLVEVTVQTCREHQHAAALTSVAAPDMNSSRTGFSLTATPRGEVVAVHHVGNAAQAVQLYEQVQQMLGESSLVHAAASSAPEFLVSALPPVLSAHSGLGAVALVVY
ncbi:DegV family protein [uncultured Rothia sp.]|uniref:DegV family protein n=1 Tax=uncultured Rothia sp. TaxID=316088 RepID=UPI0028DC0699|nr:DegV family protein [uncultured Rothia sp.]